MDAGKTGAYLAELRRARNMTQQEAADRLGVSNKTVSKWENGAGFPDITVLPALAELYGVTTDDILAGETVTGPVEAVGEARRRLLRLRLRTRFDICFAGALALGVLAWFQVAYVSLAAWPLSVGLLWIGYVLSAHPARYGDVALDTRTWENLYRKLLIASALQWWALMRLVRLDTYRIWDATSGIPYYSLDQQWKPLIFAVGLVLLYAGLTWRLHRAAGADASLLWVPERLRPARLRGSRLLRRTRQLWIPWLVWVGLLVTLWLLTDRLLEQALSPWIAEYGEELVRGGFPERWTILRERLETDIAPWVRLRQGVLAAGGISAVALAVRTWIVWKKRRPPLAEKGES